MSTTGQGTQIQFTIDQGCDYVSQIFRIVDSAGAAISWVGRTAIAEFRTAPIASSTDRLNIDNYFKAKYGL